MGQLNHDQGEFSIRFVLMRLFRTITRSERLLPFSTFLGYVQSCALLPEDGSSFGQSGANDPDARRRLRFRNAPGTLLDAFAVGVDFRSQENDCDALAWLRRPGEARIHVALFEHPWPLLS
jgi:hypothetical protein